MVETAREKEVLKLHCAFAEQALLCDTRTDSTKLQGLRFSSLHQYIWKKTLDESYPESMLELVKPSSEELRAMALRQQRQIESQHQLLAAKEQRLRFLKAQEIRGAATVAEGDRLRRLRERVEAQESKLRRLRALRGQVDLQKTYNLTLSNDLDSIRSLFSEKEKELSLAVAKVEALTRQLEELRRDRRGPLNLIPGNGQCQQLPTPAAKELEKLRRELMYRNQLSLQQDARLHLQREALQQRQAELRSVDQRILELQARLQRKKSSNLNLQSQQQSSPQISPSQARQHIQLNISQHLHYQQQQQVLSAQNQSQQLKQHQSQSHQQQQIHSSNGNQSQSPTAHINSKNTPVSIKPSNSVYPSHRVVPRGNVAAVEPYMHTPQKSTNGSVSQKQSAAVANTNQQNQLIQDLTNLKINLGHVNTNINVNHFQPCFAESDESKLGHQRSAKTSTADCSNLHIPVTKENDTEECTELANKTDSGSLPYSSRIPKSICMTSLSSSPKNQPTNECDSEKIKGETNLTGKPRKTVHSTPLDIANKPLAVSISPEIVATTSTSNQTSQLAEMITVKPKVNHQIPSGNLVVPPRKPISSVAPNVASSSIPKIVAHSPKVNKVAPNIIVPLTASGAVSALKAPTTEMSKSRPALPPKPNKSSQSVEGTASATAKLVNKPPILEPTTALNIESSQSSKSPTSSNFGVPVVDNLPIKARPLTIRKQPLSEQPKLKSHTSFIKPALYNSRRIEMPPAFLFPEIERTELKDCTNSNSKAQSETNSSTNSVDEADKSMHGEEVAPDDGQQHIQLDCPDRREKTKLSRRVSFDPLALLLDASLEGELELVKKTAMQVPNPSAANDEGITALHNAICAGHIEIVKFLVEFGCDVNAQDSDGWTPLHCAASCNNLSMVKFLVENGACLFAATLSDHETPAEKCEEDEEGFDGCSEYLYSIQEKLGILNNGEVYAVFSYDRQQPDELEFALNDPLTILRKGDDAEREWWWAKNASGLEGYVPRNLLGLYPRVPLQTYNSTD